MKLDFAPGSPQDMAALAARHPGAFQAPLRARAAALAGLGAGLAPFVFGVWQMDVSFARVFGGLGQLGHFLTLMVPPSPGGHFTLYMHALAETLAIAFFGTMLGAALALPFGLLAAKNIVPAWIFHFSVRRFLDTIRGVDTLIWALIWINVVGLGPFAGILAIASSDFGSFGKLFSEAFEAADKGAGEGVRSTGGNALHEIRFALFPQVLPVIVGQVLYFVESNTRSATIIGIVGAGGIGLHLAEQIRTLEWQQVSFLILIILVAVALIDAVSSRLRAAMTGAPAAGGRHGI